MERILNISAGGIGSRMSEDVKKGRPKHLLELPNGDTILSYIISNAEKFFDKIGVYASDKNFSQISTVKHGGKSNLLIDKHMTGPLGPMVRSFNEMKEGSTVYACAGDFFNLFDWDDFEKFHRSHEFPVSILIAKSIAVKNGARFNLKNEQIVGWERPDLTSDSDLINMGAYIVDNTPDVKKVIDNLDRHKEGAFFNKLIKNNLLAGYDSGNIGYNINREEVYQHLINNFNNL